MRRERVDALLENYHFNVGRVSFLEVAIAESIALIEKARSELIYDAMPSGGEEGMPHSPNVSKTVEIVAMRLLNGWEPDNIKLEEEEVLKMKEELAERKRDIQYVDGLLSGLPEKERWIVEKQVIGETTWRELIYDYSKQWHQQASKSTLKRLKECAMGKIYSMAE